MKTDEIDDDVSCLDHRSAIERLEGERDSLVYNENRYRAMGFTDEQVNRGMAPFRTLHQMYLEEAEDAIQETGGIRDGR